LLSSADAGVFLSDIPPASSHRQHEPALNSPRGSV
jgi:hypothetical protein